MILDILFVIGIAIGLPIGIVFLFLWSIGVIEYTNKKLSLKKTEDT